MSERIHKHGTEESGRVACTPWDPVPDSAVSALLDHLAEELAREFVRLMQQAADEEVSAEGQGR